jgi:hypothetical protein
MMMGVKGNGPEIKGPLPRLIRLKGSDTFIYGRYQAGLSRMQTGKVHGPF